MRQGNGTDLPGIGANDPRASSIGVIYVSPTDDRKSVLAAILTQEKLGRKQVAVELPNPNKAFQSPQDFDDLKNVRRRRNMKSEIAFIVPAGPGPGPAEYAHQRRFPVYSSLESFANSLQGGEPAKPDKKRGFFGGPRNRDKAAGAAVAGAVVGAGAAELVDKQPPEAVAAGAPVQAETPDIDQEPTMHLPPSYTPRNVDDEPDEDLRQPAARGGGGAGMAGAAVAGAGAGFLGADLLRRNQAGGSAAQGVGQEDWDDLPPVAQAGPASSPATPYTTSAGSEVPLTPTTVPPAAGAAEAVGEGGPGIIELPKQRRNTVALAPQTIEEATPVAAVPVSPPVTQRGAPQRRNTGVVPVAGAAAAGLLAGSALGSASGGSAGAAGSAGSAAGGTAVAAGPATGVRNVRNPAGQPPLRGTPVGGYVRGTGPRRPRRRIGLLAFLLLLLLALILAGLIFDGVDPKDFTAVTHNVIPNIGQTSSPATVTITPDSKLVQNSYQISAVTDNPKPELHQVALQALTFTTPKQQKTVAGTGHTKTAGVAAQGQLTFTNGVFSSYTVAAGTVFTTTGGVKVTSDGLATIPAATPPSGPDGSRTVNAHVVNPGAGGNLPAGAISQKCCGSDGIFVVSSAFTGGQDPQNYTFVQQSDVDGVVNPLKGLLDATAQSGLKAQLKPGQQLASMQCSAANTDSDQKIGDNGVNVTSANLTIAETCTGMAYDQAGAQTMVKNLLGNTANSNLGMGYGQVGNVLVDTKVQNTSANSVSLLMTARGIWAYQFNDNKQKQHILNTIVGKTVTDARTTLKLQKGVKDANVAINGGGNALPSDMGQITLNVQSVAGLTGTDTSPTVVSTTGGGQSSGGSNSVNGAKGMIPVDGSSKG